jgi:hypothetical protein
MKKILLLTALALTFTGCASTEKALLTSTATVTPATTNQVVSVDATTGQSVTNQVVMPPATNVTYAPSPVAVAATQTIAALPFPFAGTAGIALGWLLTAYAAWKNKKLSVALVQGIDAGRQILQTTPEGQKLDAKFKDALIEHQEIAGVLNAASTLVNDYTGDTVKPAA